MIHLQEELAESILLNVVMTMVCNRKTQITCKYFSKQRWTDEELAWNVSEYNVRTIRLPSTEIWLPDVVFYSV